MDRAEFLRMMGVDAIVTSSGKYNISFTEAELRTGFANIPVFAAGVYIGAKVSPVVIAYVSASQYAEIMKSAASIIKRLGPIPRGLLA
jgi:hypothetical protein